MIIIDHVFLSLRPVWNFVGHVGRLSQILWSVHWSEPTIFPVSPVQHVNSKLESKHLLREKLEKFIASRTTTGMRVKNNGEQESKTYFTHRPQRRHFFFVVLLNVICPKQLEFPLCLKGAIQIKLSYLVYFFLSSKIFIKEICSKM